MINVINNTKKNKTFPSRNIPFSGKKDSYTHRQIHSHRYTHTHTHKHTHAHTLKQKWYKLREIPLDRHKEVLHLLRLRSENQEYWWKECFKATSNDAFTGYWNEKMKV